MSQSAGGCRFAWSTPPGQICQVQYKTDLNQSNWLNLGGPAAVNNGVVSASDRLINGQRFYRLLVLP